MARMARLKSGNTCGSSSLQLPAPIRAGLSHQRTRAYILPRPTGAIAILCRHLLMWLID
ncbi:MAG: hypothetical protein V7K53_13605 [Nostoc sp.]